MTALDTAQPQVERTPAEQAAPCPDVPVYTGGDLGAVPYQQGTAFRVWAPTASGITLRLFNSGSPDECADAQQTVEMTADADGTWVANCKGVGHGTYYDYLVRFADGTENRTADPWAKAAGVNGQRSMVVDLSLTDPEGWADDHCPSIPNSELVIWETHVGDFSYDEHSGVPAEHRGTYLGFTHPDTSVDGKGEFPTCVAYLKHLGVTAVQMMPMYDYGSVDESVPLSSADHGYNWGYDPVNYNVPEGSYSTNPADGAVRINECKQMIQALHAAGFKVIMDVVYNHMYTTDNWFERMIPGYACRRLADGTFADGSACSNDIASEHPMMRKYIIDSCVYWASEYHVDGFRFDLMGLIDTDTMNGVRAALDQLPNGEDIFIHGEPWAAGQTALDGDIVLADKNGMPLLDSRIGAFCDSTRDAVRGHVFYQQIPGYATGAAQSCAAGIRSAINGWRDTDQARQSVLQVTQYVSAHDDLTLWDKLCAATRFEPEHEDYEADPKRCSDLLAANQLASTIVFTAAGVPFVLSGEEFARTKYGNHNTFNASADVNKLDWQRAQRMSALVDHYRTLINLRKADHEYFDGERLVVQRLDAAVVFRVHDDCIALNPLDETLLQDIRGLESDGNDSGHWTCVYCSDGSMLAQRDDLQFELPPRSVAIWRKQ